MDYRAGSEPDPHPPAPLDLVPILGTWWNTNHRTMGITKVELVVRGRTPWMRVWAADPLDGPHEWGEAPVTAVYADGPFSSVVAGYTATFELGHARTAIQANLNLGLTILAAFTTFLDGSGRANYLSREFYSQVGEWP
ncbi:MAG TPA: hypothetical protein VJT31_20845 [Rugosimonospora sp.]|nr:hypothetical protein [Rugosimonospora sp.]